ncbi:MAG TPA: heptosyltransferase [Bacteroidales bacterium]|nr:MAG: heptosyltransferase [Bacteroidetes bacterium GWE2_42_24]OFY26078.1 MAG: heptosyltransferase [Bacteroidetes bacterium GWF2_43_11]HAQ65278.1 heptosyltransferase [Bacteroidales bacterium]HBZ65389.1 heptosyltransferase [Bacteroidales bacterium]
MKKILIIQTASIGDVILATPVIEKWHRYHPDDAVDILVKKGNDRLFTAHPFLRHVLVWNKQNDKYRNLLELLRFIQQERYDLIINLQRFASSGFLTAFSRAVHTRGFSKNPFSVFFSKRFPHYLDGRHEVDRNLSLLSGLVPEGTTPMQLYPPADSFAKVSQYKTHSYLTVAPASLWVTKQFPAVKWSGFLKQVTDYQVLLLGSKDDVLLCDSIVTSVGGHHVLNLAGKLSLMDTAALMRDAVMNYVNDSAPMHLASAMNAPVTAVYCSTVPHFGFGPRSDNSSVIETSESLACRPCGLHGYKECPEKHFKCATTIDINKLLSRLNNE